MVTFRDFEQGRWEAAGVCAAYAQRLGGEVDARHLGAPRGRGRRHDDADTLPVPGGSNDVVVCNFGVPHFPDPDGFVRDAARVLRPGGRLAYTAWARPELTKAFGAALRAVREHGTFEVGLPPGPTSSCTPTRRPPARAWPPRGSRTSG